MHQGPKNCQQQPIEAQFDEPNSGIAPTPPALTPKRESMLFGKINLDGTKDWSEELKTKTKDLFRDFAHIFALESLEMGHTSIVKHKIKLDN